VNTSGSILKGIFDEFLGEKAVILFDLKDPFVAVESHLISSTDTTKPSVTLDAMLKPIIFFSDTI
jgi:hypothetical protein